MKSIRLFFYFFIAELLLCGSGQVIHVAGGLTLRMFNFLIAIGLTVPLIINRRIGQYAGNMLMFYLFTTMVALSFCLISNNQENLFADIKQLSFFLTLPFIYFMVSDKKVIQNVCSIIKWSSLFMSVAYLVYIVLIKYLKVIDFNIFYVMMEEESDFMFRGDEGELFYKGFLYLTIGLLFWMNEKKWLFSLLHLLAIYYTQTRGFYVITLLAILLLYVTRHKMKPSTAASLFLLCLLLLFVTLQLGLFDVGEDRTGGDELRMLTALQVIERITPFSFLFGHGFGYGVPVRDIHMENSILEIFHKQGILGLSFWGLLLWKIYADYKRTPTEYKQTASLFMIGAVCVYVQSLFNPFLINPIGMSFVLLSFVVSNKLSRLNESSLRYNLVQ
ncbi:hypothetical protein [Bacteroides gallinarum]|uniref:hypothetical protein n=1 Tax=Bacteroides gallinarum TaxID=376806 RepID=UPI00036FA059|nr:hypothetical protein [Bacteroides gallinarum]